MKKKRVLTFFQCWFIVVKKQKPQGYLKNALSRVPIEEKDEKKRVLTSLQRCFTVMNKRKKRVVLKKALSRILIRRKKWMARTYCFSPIDRYQPSMKQR